MEYLVGIDWGTQTHRIAVLNKNGRVMEQFNAEHSGEGLVVLVNKLKQGTACDPALVAVGIEVAWGALVETLVESGFSVFSINPKQVDRFTVAGAKDDARDALVLARSLLTDRHSYKRVDIDSPDLLRLRELSRFQDELKVELRRTTNRLWQQLHRYYPQMLSISPVTRQSGKRKTVGMRQACSPRLRNAVFHWATSSLCCDSRSRRQYDALRAAGTFTHEHCAAWPTDC